MQFGLHEGFHRLDHGRFFLSLYKVPRASAGESPNLTPFRPYRRIVMGSQAIPQKHLLLKMSFLHPLTLAFIHFLVIVQLNCHKFWFPIATHFN